MIFIFILNEKISGAGPIDSFTTARNVHTPESL
jgi:hypothetical protein